MAELPQLSVVIATRDRAGSLARCLDMLQSAWDSEPCAWEILVVDNGSQDDTPALARAFADHASFPVRCLSEPKPGVSRARNSGARAARALCLAFTDDDCEVLPGWAQALLAAFAGPDGPEVVGGRVDLADAADLPTSIRPFPDALTITDFDALTARMIGCNLAVLRRTFRALGGFDPRLGGGTPAGSGEDLDLVYRALRAGARIRYEPAARLRHAHGRRGHDERQRLAQLYTRGRGALYAKYVMRGDLAMLRRLYWELRGPAPARGWLLQGALSRLRGAG